MKNEKKHQVLCDGLMHGLNVKVFDVYSHERDKVYKLDANTIGIQEERICIASAIDFGNKCKPILHEMDLTKEITIGGETFVPLDKIASLRGFEYWSVIKNPEEPDCFIVQFRDEDDSTLLDEFKPMVLNFSALYDLPFFVIDLLNKWHFNWRNLPESDYVKVSSLPKSPYA